ncbi:radical SAM family heme chaperone HemW [Gammaproteobacteria bacterium]|nr:radical SAM family heme chaperone HemW [Gammaproteobacteria bacterium]
MSQNRLSLPPLSLYVHIPWCLKKCPYCDFNSHAFQGELPEQAYINSLLADLKRDLRWVQNRELTSIFIGGGTPSLFSPASIERLLSAIEQSVGFSADIEITMEANPGTFEMEKFRDFRHAGINRLSLGIQSFNKNYLNTLGRVHDDVEALTAASNVRKAGFDNFNLDLMFGLPQQGIDEALADLRSALAVEPEHLSWYQLTIEPNTVFYSKPPSLPEDDLLGDMQEAGVELLSAQGFSRYEVSAFSKPNKQSTHNLNYWRFGDYLGIGAGAHGKITLPAEQQIIRTRKIRQPASYLEHTDNTLAGCETITTAELPIEFMMNALRLSAGTEESLFQQRTGLPISEIAGSLQRLRNAGLLRKENLATTDKGFNFLNNVLAEFMPDEPAHENRINLVPG